MNYSVPILATTLIFLSPLRINVSDLLFLPTYQFYVLYFIFFNSPYYSLKKLQYFMVTCLGD